MRKRCGSKHELSYFSRIRIQGQRRIMILFLSTFYLLMSYCFMSSYSINTVPARIIQEVAKMEIISRSGKKGKGQGCLQFLESFLLVLQERNYPPTHGIYYSGLETVADDREMTTNREGGSFSTPIANSMFTTRYFSTALLRGGVQVDRKQFLI